MMQMFKGLFLRANRFSIGFLILLAAFLITRLQYFLYYPVLVLSSDSASYCAAAFDIMSGRLPLFDIRTPGYPLFLSAVWSIERSAFAVSLIQSVFTFASSAFLLFALSRVYSKHTILFAVVISAFVTSSYFLVLEDAILTEGIFVSTLMMISGLLVIAVKEQKVSCWFWFSCASGLLIVVRPAGIFIAAVFAVIVIYFIANKLAGKNYAALFIPAGLILFSLCLYNYSTLRLFTLTPFGEANLSGVTVLFMEPSPDYPEFVNTAIRNTLDSIPKKDISAVRNSNDPSKLYHTFNDNFYRQTILVENMMRQDPTLTYVAIQPMLRKISLDAIRKNPSSYARFFASNFLFFFNNSRIVMDYYEQLSNIFNRTFIDRKYVKEIESGRWRQISTDKTSLKSVSEFFSEQMSRQADLKYINSESNGRDIFRRTFLMSLCEIYLAVTEFLFRNFVWILIFASTSAIAITKCLKSRFKNNDSVIATMLSLMFFSKALLVSLVEVSLSRYSYTVEFAVFLSLPFLLILMSDKRRISKDKLS